MRGLAAVSAIFLKDIEDAARSQTLLLVLLGPVVLSVFFARSFSGDDVRRPSLALYDPSGSGLARALRSSEFFRLWPVDSWQEGRDLVLHGKVAAALAIPQGFDARLREQRFPRLDLAVDETAKGQVEFIREGLRAVLRQQAGQEMPADICVEKIREFTGGVRQALLPIWVVFTCLGGSLVTCSSLGEEREKGTLSAILAAPVRIGEVLAGKTAAGALLALTSAGLVLALNEGWRGNLPALAAMLTAGCVVFAGLGTVLGLSLPSASAAGAASSLVYLVLFVPVGLADLSLTMQAVARWNPAWYLYDGITRALLARASAAELAPQFGVLALAAILVAGAGAWQLARQKA